MNKTFDELFDEFFGNGPKKDNKKMNLNLKGMSDGAQEIDPKNLPDDLPKPIKDIIKALTGMEDVTDEDKLDKDVDLGTPTDEEKTTDGDTTYEKKTWDTEFGKVTRITVSGSTNNLDNLDAEEILNELRRKMGLSPIGSTNKSKKKLSLEEELEIAIEKEEYEKAASIRDQIKERDKNN